MTARQSALHATILFFTTVLLCSNAHAQAPLESNKVMAFFANQQYDDAISYLIPLEAKDSNNIQVLGYLGYAHHMNDNNISATNYYNRMLAIDSNSISALQYVSTDGDTETRLALVLTRRLVSLQPQKPAYKKNLAGLLRKINQRDSALVYYKQAYDLAPNDSRYVAPYAETLLDQKQTARADSMVDAGLLRDSMNVAYLMLRIRSAYESKDYQHVLLPGERLIRTKELLLKPLLNLSLAYYNLKMYNDCIRVCDYLLEQGFEVESVFYYKARAWAKLNDYIKSNELLEMCLAIAISSTAEMYYYNLAENNEAVKQYKKAVSYYDSAFYLFKNPNMLYNAGRVSESELKNEKLAKKYYSQYLKKAAPQSADEKKVYEYVRNRMSKKKTDVVK